MTAYPGHDADGNPTVALYKIVGPAGECLNGGTGRWSLPVDGEPGAWWDIVGPLVPCSNALHLTDAEHMETWLPRSAYGYAERSGHRVFLAETRGEVINAGEKYAVRSARLVREVPVADALREREAGRREARARLDTALARATRAYGAIVPPALAVYASAIGKAAAAKLPNAAALARIPEAQAAYDAIAEPAKRRYEAALKRAGDAFARRLAAEGLTPMR